MAARGIRETERAIKLIKDDFERRLADALNLERVSAPVFLCAASGQNDDLSGVERPVSFELRGVSGQVQIIHSLAKWKREALARYGFSLGEGLYTDMNAIRRDEDLDCLHSAYVDQWDWELVISPEQRTLEFLRGVVLKIVGSIRDTGAALRREFPGLPDYFEKPVYFVSTEELLNRWPGKTPKEREDLITEERGVVFLTGIGGALSDGSVHDGRAPDYDDWDYNGDILVYYPPLGRAVELSSMGIRVSPQSLERQLAAAGREDKKDLPFHKSLLAGLLPYTIGGGIGQSRLCMVLLGKAHIGEVQASIWPDGQAGELYEKGIFLL